MRTSSSLTSRRPRWTRSTYARSSSLTGFLLVNPGGYIGESTGREVAYARATGKPVSFTDIP